MTAPHTPGTVQARATGPPGDPGTRIVSRGAARPAAGAGPPAAGGSCSAGRRSSHPSRAVLRAARGRNRDVPSPAAAAVPRLLSPAAGIVARRKASLLGLSVMAMIALAAGVSPISGSSRFLLARDGWLAGARRPSPSLGRCWKAGGSSTRSARTWAAPAAQSWDELRDQVLAFRRAWRPPPSSGAPRSSPLPPAWRWPGRCRSAPSRPWGAALWPVTFVVLQVITNVYFYRSGQWLILRERGQPEPGRAFWPRP